MIGSDASCIVIQEAILFAPSSAFEFLMLALESDDLINFTGKSGHDSLPGVETAIHYIWY